MLISKSVTISNENIDDIEKISKETDSNFSYALRMIIKKGIEVWKQETKKKK
jgi:DNA-binding sugar fermentation-stimulating protein